jgi:hypothetical protein
MCGGGIAWDWGRGWQVLITYCNTHGLVQAEILNEHNLEKYSFYMHTDVYCNLQFTTNTFQGILITNGTDSYAVFIYECGGMEWDGGEIGWRDGSSQQVTHPLNGSSNSSDIGCLYSETYSAIVYRLHCKCTGSSVSSSVGP